MQPEVEKEIRPATGGTDSKDLLAGGVDTNCTASALADEVCDAAELSVTAAVLSATTIDSAKRLLNLVPVDAFTNPTARFVVFVATELVDDLVLPAPIAVVTHAQRHGISIPIRVTPIAALAQIAAEASVFGIAEWAAREVCNNHHRKIIAAAGQRISTAAWSDSAELAELVERQIAAITAAVEAVAG